MRAIAWFCVHVNELKSMTISDENYSVNCVSMQHNEQTKRKQKVIEVTQKIEFVMKIRSTCMHSLQP